MSYLGLFNDEQNVQVDFYPNEINAAYIHILPKKLVM